MMKKQACGCSGSSCDSGGAMDRRAFVKLATAGAAALGIGELPAMAGPFEDENEYLRVIPHDKRLDPAWVRSLFERGEKQVYRDPTALAQIGMPVGGLFAGTVYLSGDGRLWLWDIFNRDQEGILPRDAPELPGIEGNMIRSGLNYVYPAPLSIPFRQGFALRIGEVEYTLDGSGFSEVTFDGRYPLGRVSYRDADCPLTVELEAFSPFIPLNLEDSSLPATLMRYRITNASDRPVEADLVGHLQNAICSDTPERPAGRLRNEIIREQNLTAIACRVEPASAEAAPRPEILFEDFERPTYDRWQVEGAAFGDGPIAREDIPAYQRDVAGEGERVVNTHASAPGDTVSAKDSQVGKLLSRPFKIERNYIRLLIGGGDQPKKTCVNLLIDGQIVASLTGDNENRLRPAAFDVRKYQGEQAQLALVDASRKRWGNLGVDQIVFSDTAPASSLLAEQRDFGTMTLTLLEPSEADHATAAIGEAADQTSGSLDDELVGQLGRRLKLGPGETAEITFAFTWHFPNFYARGVGGGNVGHAYAARFTSALDVARYLAANRERLVGDTRQWVDAWYDSTLPYWLLDRTMANTSTLATTTCYRFRDGQFWAWEGIGCCRGTCTHVWHYAQAPGRLFPALERDQRERVDFGIALHANGGIGMRAGLHDSNQPADDGQCGRILGAYREHQMATDDAFLRRIWPEVKRALEYMIRKDDNADGMVEGSQPNTLDADWFGKVPFLASLYVAALRAGESMAVEMDDAPFAAQCRTIADRGAQSILECFNGEYFVQIESPQHPNAIGVGDGCYIDQVFGQTWAYWVGLGNLFDRDKQLSALRALWKYNFVPDVGPFREAFPRGRWYAMAGDAGLLMCTWPRGGQNPKFKDHWQYQYFNECMSGFEWQVAAHMVWEGAEHPDLLQSGLAIGRAIHDRYDPALRNPYNEIECSDHYARAMASYGLFQAACGFSYHGPQGRLGFAPRLSPEDFKAPLVTAAGWGSYEQRQTLHEMHVRIHLRQGGLTCRELELTLDKAFGDRPVRGVTLNGEALPTFQQDGRQVRIAWDAPQTLDAGAAWEFILTAGA